MKAFCAVNIQTELTSVRTLFLDDFGFFWQGTCGRWERARPILSDGFNLLFPVAMDPPYEYRGLGYPMNCPNCFAEGVRVMRNKISPDLLGKNKIWKDYDMNWSPMWRCEECY